MGARKARTRRGARVCGVETKVGKGKTRDDSCRLSSNQRACDDGVVGCGRDEGHKLIPAFDPSPKSQAQKRKWPWTYAKKPHSKKEKRVKR